MAAPAGGDERKAAHWCAYDGFHPPVQEWINTATGEKCYECKKEYCAIHIRLGGYSGRPMCDACESAALKLRQICDLCPIAEKKHLVRDCKRTTFVYKRLTRGVGGQWMVNVIGEFTRTELEKLDSCNTLAEKDAILAAMLLARPSHGSRVKAKAADLWPGTTSGAKKAAIGGR